MVGEKEMFSQELAYEAAGTCDCDFHDGERVVGRFFVQKLVMWNQGRGREVSRSDICINEGSSGYI